MKQRIAMSTLLVHDYDEAINFFVGKLGFKLSEDTSIPAQNKRWVVVSPAGSSECALLLAKASNENQESAVGKQTGGRVGYFLHTDNFWRDYKQYQRNGVVFIEEPRHEAYGTVAVFEDICGNTWDLLEPKQEVTI